MFLNTEDLGSTIYDYQIDDITEGNEDIVHQAMQAAEEEIRSYLSANNKKEWLDGRLRYDVNSILNAMGTQRNSLLVRHGATIAKWYIIELSNTDIVFETAKSRYDRAIAWLEKLATGKLNLSTLPTMEDPEETDDNDTSFIWGSRVKFTHE